MDLNPRSLHDKRVEERVPDSLSSPLWRRYEKSRLALLVLVRSYSLVDPHRPPAGEAALRVVSAPRSPAGCELHDANGDAPSAQPRRVVHTTRPAVPDPPRSGSERPRSFLVVAVDGSGDYAQARVFPRVRCARPRSRRRDTWGRSRGPTYCLFGPSTSSGPTFVPCMSSRRLPLARCSPSPCRDPAGSLACRCPGRGTGRGHGCPTR